MAPRICFVRSEDQDPQVKQHMPDYLIAVIEDANDFSWDAARASHTVLLCMMDLDFRFICCFTSRSTARVIL